MSDTLTGNTDIDWLRSTTTAVVEHTKEQPAATPKTTHVARFGIKPKSVPLVKAPYSKYKFWPLFMTCTWVNGELSDVHITGRKSVKGRDGIGLIGCDRTFHTWSHSSRLNRDRMPQLVRDSIASYEHKIPVQSANPMVIE